ncbi:MAG: UTRA domain-containing protein, partial [Pseudomonadota bacterium]
TRFTQGVKGQARTTQRELLDTSMESAPAHVAKALKLKDNEKVWRLETLNKVDGVPVSRATAWYGAERFPDMTKLFEKHRSVTKALREQGVEDYQRASTQVEAMLARGDDLSDLSLAPGAVVLVTRSINVDMQGYPVEHAITRFAADRVVIDIIDSQTDIS